MIKAGAIWAVIVIGVAFYDVTAMLAGNGTFPFGVLSGTALVLAVITSTLLPWLRYRFWRFDLREEELYLERGIFNRVRTIVPLRRIQHLDVSQDLLEREFDLGKLIVHTAGTRSSDVVLPGLQYDEAEQLRDDLRHYITEEAF